MTDAEFSWRGAVTDAEVNRLHGAAFAYRVFDDPWNDLLARHSLGWVTARRAGDLVGFVNVIWDGLAHAWIQDTIVDPASQRTGIGTGLITVATEHSRIAGCEWLHVDFDDDAASFYLEACGFEPTGAGLINLADPLPND